MNLTLQPHSHSLRFLFLSVICFFCCFGFMLCRFTVFFFCLDSYYALFDLFFSVHFAFLLNVFLFLFSLFFRLRASCFTRFGSSHANKSISNNLFPFFAFLTYILAVISIFSIFSHFRNVGSQIFVIHRQIFIIFSNFRRFAQCNCCAVFMAFSKQFSRNSVV